MNKNGNLTPHELCELFDISKSTLFRWEKDGFFPEPPQRDDNDDRHYSKIHIEAITQKKRETFIKQMKKWPGKETEASLTRLKDIMKKASLNKFLAGKFYALYEVEELGGVHPKMIKRLIKFAMDNYEPDESRFCDIMRVVYISCCSALEFKGSMPNA